MRLTILFASLTAVLGLAACSHKAPPAPPPVTNATVGLSQVANIGRQLFYDRSLSASGQLSCASCHDPAHAFAPANNLPVQPGGPDMHHAGLRAVPSLAYRLDTPNFHIGQDLPDELDDRNTNAGKPASAEGIQLHGPLARITPQSPKIVGKAPAMVPQGGLFWDGRADTLQGQALGPLLNPDEMANKDADALVARLAKITYAAPMKQLFGPNILQDKRLLLSESLFAIARYEAEETAFHAYSSKYDAVLAGKATLTPAEAHGKQLFEDPHKGNCAACHPDKKSADSRPPAFTDYQYEALGLPRNPAIPANKDPAFFDLGICGPSRTDSYARQPANCGLFKTPSLRNVATRKVFFHNGVFHSLDDVLHFYVERDIHPEKFYPRDAKGKVSIFNDLPSRYRKNIDTLDAPLNRHPGDQPALTDAEISDVVAFLGTLTDGYSGTGK